MMAASLTRRTVWLGSRHTAPLSASWRRPARHCPSISRGPRSTCPALISLASFDHSSCAATLCARSGSGLGSATEEGAPTMKRRADTRKALSVMPRRGRRLAPGAAAGPGRASRRGARPLCSVGGMMVCHMRSARGLQGLAGLRDDTPSDARGVAASGRAGPAPAGRGSPVGGGRAWPGVLLGRRLAPGAAAGPGWASR